jgi:hypothetical protein
MGFFLGKGKCHILCMVFYEVVFVQGGLSSYIKINICITFCSRLSDWELTWLKGVVVFGYFAALSKGSLRFSLVLYLVPLSTLTGHVLGKSFLDFC